MPNTHYLLKSADILTSTCYIDYLKRNNITHVILVNPNLNVDGNLAYALKSCREKGIIVDKVISPFDCSLATNENDRGNYLGRTFTWMEQAEIFYMELHQASVDIFLLDDELSPLRKEINLLQKAISENLISKEATVSELQTILTKPKAELDENGQRLKDMLGYYYQENKLPHIKQANDGSKTLENVTLAIKAEMNTILEREIPADFRVQAIAALDAKDVFYQQYFAQRKVKKRLPLPALYQRCKTEGLVAANDTVVFIGDDPEDNDYNSLRACFPSFRAVTTLELNPDVTAIFREPAPAIASSRAAASPSLATETVSTLPINVEPSPATPAPKLHVFLYASDTLRNGPKLHNLRRLGVSHVTVIYHVINVNGDLSYLLKACQDARITVEQVISSSDCTLAAQQNTNGKYLGQTYNLMKAADLAFKELHQDNININNNFLTRLVFQLRYEQRTFQQLFDSKLLNKDAKLSEINAIKSKPENQCDANEKLIQAALLKISLLCKNPLLLDPTYCDLTVEALMSKSNQAIAVILARNNLPAMHQKILAAIDAEIDFYKNYPIDHDTATLQNLMQRCKSEGMITENDVVVFVGDEPQSDAFQNFKVCFPNFYTISPGILYTNSHPNHPLAEMYKQHPNVELNAELKAQLETPQTPPAKPSTVTSQVNPLKIALKQTRTLLNTANGQRVSKEITSVITAVNNIIKQNNNRLDIDTYVALTDILQAVNIAIEKPTQNNIYQCKTYAKQAQGHGSLLWQVLGVALMALGAALIVVGTLVATVTLGLATIPGATAIAAGATATQFGVNVALVGGTSLITGIACTFFGQTRGFAKELNNLTSALQKANPEQRPADSVTAPLLQNP